ncbi:thioredoxin family protein [Sulfurospirillum arsenophilum]|uniref:thioredoxin family protein n=1 Tax=Sulfurospirillum arsenophilum TaxID=56698 RepID=UPI0005A78E78|nr:thioredoxin family protein [Sulfurospirillum arsenophilum]
MYTLLRLLFVAFMSMTMLHASFLEEESARAIKEKKLILVNVVTENCPYCKQMQKEIFNNATYRKQIDQKFVFVSIDLYDPALPADLRTKYTPANAILSPTRHSIIEGYTGYMDPASFMSVLENAYKAEFK